jgi:NTE family protein
MSQEPTEQVRSEYMPRPERQRRGVALCLSGGGFRASLFHLGALRRLNELGVLSRVDVVSSVSGGSIISAHVASRLDLWPAPGTAAPDWETKISAPFRDYASKNVRTPALLRRVLPWNWPRPSAGVRALAASYERNLAHRGGRPLLLSELPERPLFVFCATDMAFGVNWISARDRVGDYQVGYAQPSPPWTVGRAVAASSCFPPVFNPLPVELEPQQFAGGLAGGRTDYGECVRGLRLTDGGNYDNLGLEPVWKGAEYILVSDGGAIFEAEPDRSLVWRLSRYTDILSNQVSALRKRWLISNLIAGEMQGTYWGIGSDAAGYESGVIGYPKALVAEVISKVRTDLDAFSPAEAAVLENHGYMLAEAAIKRHIPTLAALPAPFAVPHPEWLDEAKVRRALADSYKRKFPFGRFNPS